MNADDDICYCYHVPLRKLVAFAKRVRPRRASQMTECLGAGTGCGWCIPFLKKIAADPEGYALVHLNAEEYAARRQTYIKTQQPKNTFDEGEDRSPEAGQDSHDVVPLPEDRRTK